MIERSIFFSSKKNRILDSCIQEDDLFRPMSMSLFQSVSFRSVQTIQLCSWDKGQCPHGALFHAVPGCCKCFQQCQRAPKCPNSRSPSYPTLLEALATPWDSVEQCSMGTLSLVPRSKVASSGPTFNNEWLYLILNNLPVFLYWNSHWMIIVNYTNGSISNGCQAWQWRDQKENGKLFFWKKIHFPNIILLSFYTQLRASGLTWK